MSESLENPFGRVDAEGNVFVKTAAGEVPVGQYAAGTPAEGLEFFTRKHEALVADAGLALSRLASGKGNPEGALELAGRLEEQAVSPTCVGDLNQLVELAGQLRAAATERAAERAAAKAAAKQQTLARREAIAVEAEGMAASTSWKTTQERFAALLEEWKALPRVDRDAEQSVWRRFSAARQQFDRARRTHHANLAKASAASKSVRKEILAEAEKLAESTDWGATTIRFRELMDAWKAAPRGFKKDDDALWARFRAAQQKFFESKQSANEVRDEELKGNLVIKLELLKEAEALLPIKDIPAAKSALRSISERWHKAGHVPRADLPKVEARLRKVEQAITEAEQEEWRKNDPSRKAFAQDTAAKFQESVTRLEAEVAEAKAKGAANLAKLEQQLVNAKALVEAAIKHA